MRIQITQYQLYCLQKFFLLRNSFSKKIFFLDNLTCICKCCCFISGKNMPTDFASLFIFLIKYFVDNIQYTAVESQKTLEGGIIVTYLFLFCHSFISSCVYHLFYLLPFFFLLQHHSKTGADVAKQKNAFFQKFWKALR